MEKENLQRQADRAKSHGRRSALTYLAILFAAAFILLLLAFFMQQRNNRQALDQLSDSMTAFDSIEQLIEDNETLRAQVQELEEQTAELEEQLAQAQTELDSLNTLTANLTLMQERLTQAMDLFWQINEAYVRGRYALCRELIEQMEDTSHGSALKESLPTESTTDTDRFSPADRYQEIYDAVM